MEGMALIFSFQCGDEYSLALPTRQRHCPVPPGPPVLPSVMSIPHSSNAKWLMMWAYILDRGVTEFCNVEGYRLTNVGEPWMVQMPHVSSIRCWVYSFKSSKKGNWWQTLQWPTGHSSDDKDKVDVQIRDDHSIMTSKQCTTTGIEKPAAMAIFRELG